MASLGEKVWNKDLPGPRCLVCGSNGSVAFRFDRSGYQIYGCRTCDVEFVMPQPTDEALSLIYNENYFLGSESESGKQMVADTKRATANLYLDVITQFVDPRRCDLLEIGCG